MDRYVKNGTSITPEETNYLQHCCVAVVGCGGLGGYVLEMLARVGIGNLTLIDSDVVDITNLNRQLLATQENLGQPKVEEAAKRIKTINSLINLSVHEERLNPDNAVYLLQGCQVVVDAVDNISTRILMETVCEQLGLPLVHGAIAGWYGQVMVVFPGDKSLSAIYHGAGDRGAETELGNPSFIPAAVASIEVAETLKVLLNKGEILRKQLLSIDLLRQQFEIVTLP